MVVKLSEILHVRVSKELKVALLQIANQKFEGDVSLTIRQLLRHALDLVTKQEFQEVAHS